MPKPTVTAVTAVAIAALLAGAPQVTAAPAPPQVTDPAGDANGVDSRPAGVDAVGDVTGPVSAGPLDVRAVHWYADDTAVFAALTLAAPPDPAQPARYLLTFATPSCATARIHWVSTWDGSVLLGCKPNHWIGLTAPRRDGDRLVFRIPRGSLRKWFAAGTTIRRLGAETAPYTDVAVMALHPWSDVARGTTPYRVGD